MMTFRDTRSESFHVGDVVTLKTGGPRMTVVHAGPFELGDNECDWLICQWFDDQGEFRQEMFRNESVVPEPRVISAGLASLRAWPARAPSM